MIDLRQTLQEVLKVQHQPDFEETYEPLRQTLNKNMMLLFHNMVLFLFVATAH